MAADPHGDREASTVQDLIHVAAAARRDVVPVRRALAQVRVAVRVPAAIVLRRLVPLELYLDLDERDDISGWHCPCWHR